jgi:hypothetical protein
MDSAIECHKLNDPQVVVNLASTAWLYSGESLQTSNSVRYPQP